MSEPIPSILYTDRQGEKENAFQTPNGKEFTFWDCPQSIP
jgi:hypothetical protein